MKVYLFQQEKLSLTLGEAESYVASFTPGSFGYIWLHHPNGTQLAVMINGKQTYPHFFPDADHPGWQLAAEHYADWDTEVEFLADNGEPTPMPLALVVPVDRTTAILRYFWKHGSRTDQDTWTSLVDGEP